MSDERDTPAAALQPLPPDFMTTRLALHRLAEQVISPARRHATGRIGLRGTPGGFGTPVFSETVQLRVLGDELIVAEQGRERSTPITTPAELAVFVGPELLPDPVSDNEPLRVGPLASRALGEWYAFGAELLERLRAEGGERLDPSPVQLWPEHFDIATELGRERDSQRAGYGASPGDELHPEPYLYVTPWSEVPDGELWQATAFRGAELSYAELLGADDQRATAMAFFSERLLALTGSPDTTP